VLANQAQQVVLKRHRPLAAGADRAADSAPAGHRPRQRQPAPRRRPLQERHVRLARRQVPEPGQFLDVQQRLGPAAEGARQRFDTTYGIGITGVAGPDGGTPEKPVGLVYIGVAYADGCDVEKCNFIGSRQIVRARSAQTALNMLRLRVLQSG